MSNIFNKYLFLLILLLKAWSTSYSDQNTFDITKSVAAFTGKKVTTEIQTITQSTSYLFFNEYHHNAETESFFEISEIEDNLQEESEADKSLSKFGSYLSAIFHAQFFESQFCAVKEKTQRSRTQTVTSNQKLLIKYQVFII